MKIAIDARFYGLENAGLGRYTINLINEICLLDKKNHYVLLLSKKWFDELELPDNFEKILVKSRHYSLQEQIEIVRLLNKVNPDLTHFLHFNVPLLFSKKYILTIHDLLMHKGIGKEATTLPKWKHLVKRIGYRAVFDHAVKDASRIIVPSNFVKSEIQKTYTDVHKDKITVIYEGVSKLPAKGGKREISKKYFLYVGNAYPHKNLKTLIEAVKHIKVNLVLVVPKDIFSNRLKGVIEKLNANSFVEVKNGVSDSTLYSLYKYSEAFVYPSFSEGFGLQGLEAMDVGTRLLASDISVFHEIYGDNALYFNPEDYIDLASCLTKIANETKKDREEKLKKAKKFVEKYSWNQMARDTLALYEG